MRCKKVICWGNFKSKIKSSLYSPHYAEACNELRGPSPRLSAWATQLRRNVATVASRWRHCADLTGPGIEPQTSRTESVRFATELTAGFSGGTFCNKIKNQPHFDFVYKKVHPIPHQANFFFVVITLVCILPLAIFINVFDVYAYNFFIISSFFGNYISLIGFALSTPNRKCANKMHRIWRSTRITVGSKNLNKICVKIIKTLKQPLQQVNCQSFSRGARTPKNFSLFLNQLQMSSAEKKKTLLKNKVKIMPPPSFQNFSVRHCAPTIPVS